MINSLTYYSVIAIFLIIWYLPICIADSSVMSRSFIWHGVIIGLAWFILNKNTDSRINNNKLLFSINLFWAYLLVYNIIWLASGTSGIIYYIISVTSWVFCANLFYRLGTLNESKKYMIKKMELVDLLKWASIFMIFSIFVHQLVLFTKIGFIFDLAAGYGVGGTDVQLFKNIYPFFLAAFSIGVFLIRRRSVALLLIALILVGIVLSNKRGPLVGMSIALFVMVMFQGNIKNVFKVAIVISILILLAYYLSTIYFPELTDSFIRRFSDEDEIGSGRLTVWSQAFQIWMNESNPIFGEGPGGSSKLISRTIWGAGLNAHSDYMDVLFQYGFLGSLLQLTYCFRIIKIIWAVHKEKQFQYKNMLIYSGTFIVVTMVYTMTYLYIVSIISSIFFFYILGKYRKFKQLASTNKKYRK